MPVHPWFTELSIKFHEKMFSKQFLIKFSQRYGVLWFGELIYFFVHGKRIVQ